MHLTRKLAHLLAFVLLLSIPVLIAEIFVRFIDNYAFSSLELVTESTSETPISLIPESVFVEYATALTVNDETDVSWLLEQPLKKPAGLEATESLKQVHADIEDSPITKRDMYKIWNSSFIDKELCRGGYFDNFPNYIFLYDSKNGSMHPRYRFIPNSVSPVGLKTNSMGWRSEEIAIDKGADTFRVAFIGASTTVNSHEFPYSYPELVSHWLNLWASANQLSTKFEVLNLGREGISSPDMAAAFVDEAIPFSPDLAVYYEGSNQFSFSQVADISHIKQSDKRTGLETQTSENGWLVSAKNYSAILNRLYIALYALNSGGEPEKPDYQFNWPSDVSEFDPPLNHNNLPANLSTILSDLKKIKTSADVKGITLVLSSFIWLGEEGLQLDPIRHQSIYKYLNLGMYPYKYADIKRLADFQNIVFKKFASEQHMPFVDLASVYPKDPDLFRDAIHNTYDGVKLRSWAMFQQLIPIIKKKIKNGLTTTSDSEDRIVKPEFDYYTASFDCRAPTAIWQRKVNTTSLVANNAEAKVVGNVKKTITTEAKANRYAAELLVSDGELKAGNKYRITVTADVKLADAAFGILNWNKSKFLEYKAMQVKGETSQYIINFEVDSDKPFYLLFASGNKDYHSTIELVTVSLEKFSSIHNLKRVKDGVARARL